MCRPFTCLLNILTADPPNVSKISNKVSSTPASSQSILQQTLAE